MGGGSGIQLTAIVIRRQVRDRDRNTTRRDIQYSMPFILYPTFPNPDRANTLISAVPEIRQYGQDLPDLLIRRAIHTGNDRNLVFPSTSFRNTLTAGFNCNACFITLALREPAPPPLVASSISIKRKEMCYVLCSRSRLRLVRHGAQPASIHQAAVYDSSCQVLKLDRIVGSARDGVWRRLRCGAAARDSRQDLRN